MSNLEIPCCFGYYEARSIVDKNCVERICKLGDGTNIVKLKDVKEIE